MSKETKKKLNNIKESTLRLYLVAEIALMSCAGYILFASGTTTTVKSVGYGLWITAGSRIAYHFVANKI